MEHLTYQSFFTTTAWIFFLPTSWISNPSWGDPEPGTFGGDEDDEQISSDGMSDREDLAADDLAREAQKKAGLPELDLDALPSAFAVKFMPLATKFVSIHFWNSILVRPT